MSDDNNLTPHEQWRADCIANAEKAGAPTNEPTASDAVTLEPTTTETPTDQA